MDNFESALCLIERLNTEGWDEVINHRSFETGQYGRFDSENLRGQICMNIALIRAHLGHTEQAIVMLEKSCEISRTIVRDDPAPAELEHLRDLLILLAHQQQIFNDEVSQCSSLEQALMIHTQLHGENNEKCANILTELGNAFNRIGEYERATSHYEHTTLLYERLLQNNRTQPAKHRELSKKLDMIYIKLL